MKIRRKSRQTSPNFLRIVLLALFTTIFVLITTSCIFLVLKANAIEQSMPNVTDKSLFSYSKNSKIYANDGKTVLAEFQIENRKPLDSLNLISPYVVNGTINTEDARFYEHKGVDYIGIFRAAGAILTGNNLQGGSTITMQLIRNTILTDTAQQISIERKLTEIMLAKKMEETYSKDEILLMYLNTINYGDGCYGIKTAAQHYFNKDPIDLNLEQAATLIGIPQAPSNLSPTVNKSACKNRRDTVLLRMLNENTITQEQYTNAISQDLVLNITNANYNNDYKYPYFTSYVRNLLMEKFTPSEIFKGDLRVTTTLNVEHQEALEQGCAAQNKKLEKGAESVAVCVDPSNGYITGMVGGSDYNQNNFNIATQKGRPCGSSFKTFTLMSAISQGIDPFNTYIDCSGPLTINGNKINNFDYGSYGKQTIQNAIARSLNTGLVRLQQKCGTNNVIDMAQTLGIKKASLPSVSTLTLGVADVTPLEMASAYATIANGGTYYNPCAITKIENSKGDTIYDYSQESDSSGEQVVDNRICGAATKVLETVFTKGTASTAQIASGQPVAGKTGTSEDYRDHTLIGYTPNLVLATWIGKRDYTPTSSYAGCNNLFKTIMDKIYSGKQIINFPDVEDPDYKKTTQNNSFDSKIQNIDASQVPNVEGMNVEDAKSLLSNYNLVVYSTNSSSYAKNVVISQSIQNDRIVLYVNKG